MKGHLVSLFLVYVFSRTFLSCLSPVGGWTWCPNIHLILMGVFQMLMVQSALLCTVPLCFLWFILPIPDWLSKFCLSWVFDSDVLSCGFLFINLLLVLFAVYYFYLIILFDVFCCCCCVLSYAFIMIDVCFKVNIKSKLSLFAFLNACSWSFGTFSKVPIINLLHFWNYFSFLLMSPRPCGLLDNVNQLAVSNGYIFFLLNILFQSEMHHILEVNAILYWL